MRIYVHQDGPDAGTKEDASLPNGVEMERLTAGMPRTKRIA
ncbi:hypothetical protein NPIL_428531, partial [Nephila pilipes]